MKRNLFLLFVIVLFSVFFAVSCSTDSPSSSSTPAPTPVVLDFNTGFEDFEDNSSAFTVNGIPGTITVGNDSADGGTSVITGSSIVSGQLSGTYSLALTATVKTSLPFSTTEGDYTVMAPIADSIGYVTINVNLNNPVDAITNNDHLYFTHKISSTSGMTYRIYFYSQDGKYCYTGNQTPSTTSNSYNFYFSSLLNPTGYTAEDVLSNLKKIVFVIRYKAYGLSQKDINFYIDNIGITHDII